ncbi:hypothetical protein ACHAWF_003485 [Thalassiosira exigua]
MESNLRLRDFGAHPVGDGPSLDGGVSDGDFFDSPHTPSPPSAEEERRRRSNTAAPPHARRRRCNRMNLGSISNLCSATLGAGALSLPFAISLTGIVLGVVLLVISAYITIVSIDVIVEACAKTRLYKFEDVSVRLVGPGAGRVLEASLLVFCFGTAVAYIVAVGDILDQGLRSIPFLWVKEGDEYAWGLMSMYSRERLMIFFWAICMLPLSMQRNVEALERFSPVGVLSILFLVLSAVIHSITHHDAVGNRDDMQQAQAQNLVDMIWPKSFWDVIQAFPIIIFAFSCQVNVCAIYEELPLGSNNSTSDAHSVLKAKQRIMARITRNGIILCMTLYICIGLFGYLDFGHATQDNILNNYCIQSTHDPLMTAASAFVAVAVVVAFPFNILPARVTLKLIWDRLRQTRRCGTCHRFFSSAACGNCLCRWSGLKIQSNEADASSVDEVDGLFSSSQSEYQTDSSHDGVVEPLLEDDRFGDRPNLIPHMSLEGLQVEGELISNTEDTLEHFLLTLFLSGSALVVAIIVPSISVIFGLMGGTAASVISFILPGMFLLALEDAEGEVDAHSSTHRKLIARLFVWGGIVIGILSTSITLYGLFVTSDTGGLDTCGKLSDGTTTPSAI